MSNSHATPTPCNVSDQWWRVTMYGRSLTLHVTFTVAGILHTKCMTHSLLSFTIAVGMDQILREIVFKKIKKNMYAIFISLHIIWAPCLVRTSCYCPYLTRWWRPSMFSFHSVINSQSAIQISAFTHIFFIPTIHHTVTVIDCQLLSWQSILSQGRCISA